MSMLSKWARKEGAKIVRELYAKKRAEIAYRISIPVGEYVNADIRDKIVSGIMAEFDKFMGNAVGYIPVVEGVKI